MFGKSRSQTEKSTMSEALGAIRGQLDLLMKRFDGVEEKQDTMIKSVAQLSGLPTRVDGHEVRIASLEASNNQRVGANSALLGLIRLPNFVWVAIAGGAGYFLSGGHLHL